MFNIIKDIRQWNKDHLMFNEPNHKYFVDGKEVISVSQLLNRYNKSFNDKMENNKFFRDIIMKAAKRGTMVHKRTEVMDNPKYKDIASIVPEISPEETRKYLYSYDDFRLKFIKTHKIEAVELLLYSKRLNLCGTVDRIYRDIKTNKILLLDIKTGKTQDINWQQQLLYKELLKDNGIEIDNISLLSLYQNKKITKHLPAKIKYLHKQTDLDNIKDISKKIIENRIVELNRC